MSHTENPHHNQETALVLRASARRDTNEVSLIWADLKMLRCLHQERPSAPFCFGDPVYLSLANHEWFCAEHAADVMEEDAEHASCIARELAAAKERMRALGLSVPTLSTERR